MSEKNLNKIEDLEWIRIFDANLIPRYLIEQIKERFFSVEKFYQHQAIVCRQVDERGCVVLNPLNLLYVLADREKIIKGFFWGIVDPLSNALVINSFSMDNSYWGEGKAVKLLEEKAREIQEGAELDRVYWITRCPKHSEKHGFKRSKHVLMEYIGYGRHIDGERCETGGDSATDDSTAEEVSEYDSGGNGGTGSSITSGTNARL